MGDHGWRSLQLQEADREDSDRGSASASGGEDGAESRQLLASKRGSRGARFKAIAGIALCVACGCGTLLVSLKVPGLKVAWPQLAESSEQNSVEAAVTPAIGDSAEVLGLQEIPPPGCPKVCGTFVPCIPGLTKATTTTFTSTTTSSTTTSTSTSSTSSSSTLTTSSTTRSVTTTTPFTTTTTSSFTSSSSTTSSTLITSSTVSSTTTTSTSSTSSSSTSSSTTSSSSTTTTTTPFICSDGCQIPLHFVDDNFCDCSDCGDESRWTCLTCGLPPPDESQAAAIGIATGVSMSAAIGIALGVGLGLSSGLAAIFIATGNFVLKVPDAQAFQDNDDAVAALRRTVAKLAETDDTEIKLILPCDKAKRRLHDVDVAVLGGVAHLRPRRLQETLGVCFQISVEGEEASSSVCQRLSGYSSENAQRILAEELSDIPGTGGVDVISFSASPNPIASNPNQNSGPDDFFDPSQAGISLGAAPPPQ